MLFHEILKQCLDLTQLKLKVLSKQVGYDASYLSRFANGKMLPKGKSALDLCESLGEVFGQQLIELNLLGVASKQLRLHKKLDRDNAVSGLTEAFISAYQNSMTHQKSQIKPTKNSVELIDYVKFVMEIKGYQEHPVTLYYHLPKLLEKRLGLKAKDRHEHSSYYIYIKDTCYYALDVYETYQKLIVSKLEHGVNFKEIELLLGL